MNSRSLITMIGLSVTYRGAERPALDGIDLVIETGEYVGIMGLNGAGKTTLGLCLNGVVPQLLPAAVTGRIEVAGSDPREFPVREMARSVGIVFDNPEFQLSQLTVADEVAFGLENLGVPSGEMPGRIREALASVGLDGLEDRSPLQLSGGQQQRLAIAAVLVMRPRILFLDEPTSNLDPAGKAAVLEIAGRLHREGMTVVVADHDVESLAEYAGRIVVIDAGRVVLDGLPGEVLGRIDELAAIGLRPPQVTEFAHALRPSAIRLPVTLAEAVPWVEGR